MDSSSLLAPYKTSSPPSRKTLNLRYYGHLIISSVTLSLHLPKIHRIQSQYLKQISTTLLVNPALYNPELSSFQSQALISQSKILFCDKSNQRGKGSWVMSPGTGSCCSRTGVAQRTRELKKNTKHERIDRMKDKLNRVKRNTLSPLILPTNCSVPSPSILHIVSL